jgi:hypothetical protein
METGWFRISAGYAVVIRILYKSRIIGKKVNVGLLVKTWIQTC